ncbi:MAG: hypothetical protein ACRESW_12150, partial [Nevskiales bacterium]
PLSDEQLDQLLSQLRGQDAESLLGESGLIGQLKKQRKKNEPMGSNSIGLSLNHSIVSVRSWPLWAFTLATIKRGCDTKAGSGSLARAVMTMTFLCINYRPSVLPGVGTGIP